MPEPERAQPSPLSPEQRARDAALTRFNRLAVYVPLALAILLAAGLMLLLTWQSLVPDSAEKQLFISGLADVVLIGWLCPMTLVLSLGPVAGIYFLVRRRQRGSYIRRPLQRFVWRTNDMLDASQLKLKDAQPRVTKPLVEAHGWAAFVRSLVDQVKRDLKRLFNRSN